METKLKVGSVITFKLHYIKGFNGFTTYDYGDSEFDTFLCEKPYGVKVKIVKYVVVKYEEDEILKCIFDVKNMKTGKIISIIETKHKYMDKFVNVLGDEQTIDLVVSDEAVQDWDFGKFWIELTYDGR